MSPPSRCRVRRGPSSAFELGQTGGALAVARAIVERVLATGPCEPVRHRLQRRDADAAGDQDVALAASSSGKLLTGAVTCSRIPSVSSSCTQIEPPRLSASRSTAST